MPLATDTKRDGIWPIWSNDAFTLREYDGIEYILEYGGSDAYHHVHNGLPVEFFNHELLDVDPTNSKSVIDFCTNWGIVFCPFFNSRLEFYDPQDKWIVKPSENPPRRPFRHRNKLSYRDFCVAFKSRHEQELSAFPEKEREFWSGELDAVAKSAFLHTIDPEILGVCRGNEYCHSGRVISLEEVRSNIMKLQDIARFFPMVDHYQEDVSLILEVARAISSRTITAHSPILQSVSHEVASHFGGNIPAALDDAEQEHAFIDGEAARFDEWFKPSLRYFLECLLPIGRNSLRSTGGRIGRLFSANPYFSLQDAICIQLDFQLGDDAPWQICAYEKCQRLFKYQRSTSLPHYYQERRKSGALYCCKNHAIYASRQLVLEAQKAANRMAANGHTKHEIELLVATNYQGLTSSQSKRVVEKALHPKLD